jgi:hypothetical protein
MTAVSQLIPNFLGGVSQQSDNKKTNNTLTSCINALPDPTFGLMKRSGGQFIAELKNASGALYSTTSFDNGKWFTIFRDASEKYLGCIKGSGVYIWNIETGAPQTVNLIGSAGSYLTGTVASDYHVLSINDYSYITNKTKVVTQQAAPSSWLRNQAFVLINTIVYNSTYTVTIDGTSYTYTTPGTGTLTIDTVLSGISTAITASGITKTSIGPGIYLSKSTAFGIAVTGGQTGDAISVFQQSVLNISKLPAQAKHGYVVQVANASQEEDDYYVKFVADNGVSGPGIWEECISPLASPGLTPSTMPHELVRLSSGVWEFRQVTNGSGSWEQRLVGDETSNPNPSFVGYTIQQLFFYRNRLGALTSNNVVLSQAGDYFNFFANSALASIDSDPIDVNTSTTKPAALSAVKPVAEGLLLFSAGEQFLLTSSNDSLTPSSVVVRSLSRYQCDTGTEVIDLGTTTVFVAKNSAYTRVFEMEMLGNELSPYVNDISKVVPEYIPNTINLTTGSGQSTLLALGSNTSRDVYLFSFYSNGRERLTQAWFQWQLSGLLQYHTIENDVYWYVTKQEGSYVIQRLNLIQSPSASTLQVTSTARCDPKLDLWKTNATAVFVDDDTKVYIPWAHDTQRQICVVTANASTSGPTYTNSGRIFLPTTVSLDAGGYYVTLSDTNISLANIIVGYTYDYEVGLPAIYYRPDPKQTDSTAYLTVARFKFEFGLSGDVSFLVKAKGRSDWTEAATSKQANYYYANDIAFTSQSTYTLPLHQKSDNFMVKVISSSPFPVTLTSMMWEGNYSTRFYKRKF